jgi:hypothetical protein
MQSFIYTFRMISILYNDTVHQELALRILQLPEPGTFQPLLISTTQGSEYGEAVSGNSKASYQKCSLRAGGLQTFFGRNIRCS